MVDISGEGIDIEALGVKGVLVPWWIVKDNATDGEPIGFPIVLGLQGSVKNSGDDSGACLLPMWPVDVDSTNDEIDTESFLASDEIDAETLVLLDESDESTFAERRSDGTYEFQF